MSEIDREHLEWYFNEITGIPLLTHPEDIQFGKEIAREKAKRTKTLGLLSREIEEASYIDDCPQLSQLTGRFVDLGKKLLPSERLLAEHNIKLAVSVANKFRGMGLDPEDLIQHANLGLL